MPPEIETRARPTAPQSDRPDLKTIFETTQVIVSSDQSKKETPPKVLPVPVQNAKERILPPTIEDEYQNYDVEMLKPLAAVVVQIPDSQGYRAPEILDFTGRVSADFEYYSRTHSLEVNTERTKILQNITDKMTWGTDVKTRVVIMNKGRSPQAFVMPDGTIFISQSLINALGSMDEIGGVLAHEVGHLVNKTFEMKVKSDSRVDTLAIGHIHEMAADSGTQFLMEKAGLNSTAYASAITKIGEFERDFEHQTGVARGSMVIAQHGVRDSSTSHLNETPVDPKLKGEVVRLNKEIARDYNSKQDLNGLKQVLPKLHPRDLFEVHDLIYSTKNGAEKVSRYSSVTMQNILTEVNQLLVSRLRAGGYSEGEITLYILSLEHANHDLSLVRSTDQLVAAAEALEEMSEDDLSRVGIMDQLLFDKNRKIVRDLLCTRFLSAIEDEMFDERFLLNQPGIPINEDVLLDVLSQAYLRSYSRQNADIVWNLIANTYLRLATDAGEQVDLDQIRALLTEIKERGIIISVLAFERKIMSARYSKFSDQVMGQPLNSINEIVNELFGTPKEPEKVFDFEAIDNFFLGFSQFEGESRRNSLGSFLNEFSEYLSREKIIDQRRLELARYFSGKVDGLTFADRADFYKLLENKHYFFQPDRDLNLIDEDKLKNDNLKKFNLKLIAGLALFSQDSEEFYTYATEIIEGSGIDNQSLSKVQLLNLCQGLISNTSRIAFYQGNDIDYIEIRNATKFLNYERFLELPFLKDLVSRYESISLGIADLNEHITDLINRSHYNILVGRHYNLYDDSIESILLGREIRENFTQILAQGIIESEYSELYKYIELFYPEGVLRDTFLREINKRYLYSEEVTVEAKTDYLVDHYDQIGPEGMVIIAEQITDMATYTVFHQKMGDRIKAYLEGGTTVTKIAGVDLVTSYFGNTFETIFRSAMGDSETGKEQSTKVANAWFDQEYQHYNQDTEKFLISQNQRSSFRSLSDLFTQLRSLSVFQRMGIVHKLLTDTKGALSSKENRKQLGALLVESLGLKPGFVSAVIQTTAEIGDPKLISFPSSKMLGPLLFRSLALNNINSNEIHSSRQYFGHDRQYTTLERAGISREQLDSIMSSDTRQISEFGPLFQSQPNSRAAQLAKDSDNNYYTVTNNLQGLLKEEEGDLDEESREIKLDAATESILGAIESGSALGVRSLQLANQLYSFSPEVARRLSQSFDSNHGVNKLIFLDNLFELSQKEPAVGGFLSTVTINDYLGGGSLYTVYAGTQTREDGSTKKIVLKALNPNAEFFVKATHELATKTLIKIARTDKNKQNRRAAGVGLMLINLARAWCEQDINDKTFEEDDDRYKASLAGLQVETDINFFVPERVFNSQKLKAEDQVEGRTLNKILNDETVDLDIKKRLVRETTKMYLTQLDGPDYVDDATQDTYKLVHSDPSVGNFVIDETTPDLQEGIIDRNMYLRLNTKDIALARMLIQGGNDNQFVYTFIDRALDANTRNPIRRAKVTGQVFGAVAREYLRQRSRGQVDRLSILQTLSTELEGAKITVPIGLRLIVRNIASIQELLTRYDLNWGDIAT